MDVLERTIADLVQRTEAGTDGRQRPRTRVGKAAVARDGEGGGRRGEGGHGFDFDGSGELGKC